MELGRYTGGAETCFARLRCMVGAAGVSGRRGVTLAGDCAGLVFDVLFKLDLVFFTAHFMYLSGFVPPLHFLM